MMGKTHYLRCDLSRAFCSIHFGIAILGTCITMIIVAQTQVRFPMDVLYIYDGIRMTRMVLLTLLFSAVPYGASFCEDFSQHFIHVSLIRGDIKKYVWSKVTVIFASAVIAMFIGMLLFFALVKLKFPWVSTDNSLYQAMMDDSVRDSIIRYSPILFFIEGSIRESLLAGILAVSAALGSLFFKNKLFVFTFPIMFYYFFINYLEQWLHLPEPIALYRIFGMFYRVWEKEKTDLIYSIVFCAIIVCLVGFLIHKKIEKEIRRS